MIFLCDPRSVRRASPPDLCSCSGRQLQVGSRPDSSCRSDPTNFTPSLSCTILNAELHKRNRELAGQKGSRRPSGYTQLGSENACRVGQVGAFAVLVRDAKATRSARRPAAGRAARGCRCTTRLGRARFPGSPGRQRVHVALLHQRVGCELVEPVRRGIDLSALLRTAWTSGCDWSSFERDALQRLESEHRWAPNARRHFDQFPQEHASLGLTDFDHRPQAVQICCQDVYRFDVGR